MEPEHRSVSNLPLQAKAEAAALSPGGAGTVPNAQARWLARLFNAAAPRAFEFEEPPFGATLCGSPLPQPHPHCCHQFPKSPRGPRPLRASQPVLSSFPLAPCSPGARASFCSLGAPGLLPPVLGPLHVPFPLPEPL